MALGRVCFVSVVLWLCLGQAHTVGSDSHTVSGRSSAHNEASVTTSRTRPNPPLPNQQLVAGNQYVDSQSRAQPAARPFQCRAGAHYVGSYPRGFSNGPNGVDSIYFLLQGERLSESQCLQHCCSLGPLHCQYLWRFKDSCFAVHCSSLSSSCNPQSAAPKAASITTYVSVQFYNLNPFYQTGTSQTPAVPSPLDAYLPHPPSSPDPSFSSSPSVSDNSLPIAVISPPRIETNSSEAILSARRSSPEQGIVQYLWELVSVQPPKNEEGIFIKGSHTETLHLSALLPGSYTVKLTITDGTGRQNSTTGTVVVLTTNPSHSLQHPSNASTEKAKETETTEQTTQETEAASGGAPTEDHLTAQSTTASNTRPKVTTTATKHQPLETVAVQDMATGVGEISSEFNWTLLMEVGIPVLAIVVFILLISAALVAISSCAFVQAEKRQYRYRKLRYTETA